MLGILVYSHYFLVNCDTTLNLRLVPGEGGEPASSAGAGGDRTEDGLPGGDPARRREERPVPDAGVRGVQQGQQEYGQERRGDSACVQ